MLKTSQSARRVAALESIISLSQMKRTVAPIAAGCLWLMLNQERAGIDLTGVLPVSKGAIVAEEIESGLWSKKRISRGGGGRPKRFPE